MIVIVLQVMVYGVAVGVFVGVARRDVRRAGRDACWAC